MFCYEGKINFPLERQISEQRRNCFDIVRSLVRNYGGEGTKEEELKMLHAYVHWGEILDTKYDLEGMTLSFREVVVPVRHKKTWEKDQQSFEGELKFVVLSQNKEVAKNLRDKISKIYQKA